MKQSYKIVIFGDKEEYLVEHSNTNKPMFRVEFFNDIEESDMFEVLCKILMHKFDIKEMQQMIPLARGVINSDSTSGDESDE